MSNAKIPEILRQDEARQILLSVEDLTTNQLLNKANMCILSKYMQNRELLMSDFDLKFFLEAMLEFCSDHENLKRILDGENLRWFDDDEMENPNLTEQPTQQSI